MYPCCIQLSKIINLTWQESSLHRGMVASLKFFSLGGGGVFWHPPPPSKTPPWKISADGRAKRSLGVSSTVFADSPMLGGKGIKIVLQAFTTTIGNGNLNFWCQDKSRYVFFKALAETSITHKARSVFTTDHQHCPRKNKGNNIPLLSTSSCSSSQWPVP